MAAPDLHFAPYGDTTAACGEPVPQGVAWDKFSGDYNDARFTVRADLTNCPDCVERGQPS